MCRTVTLETALVWRPGSRPGGPRPAWRSLHRPARSGSQRSRDLRQIGRCTHCRRQLEGLLTRHPLSGRYVKTAGREFEVVVRRGAGSGETASCHDESRVRTWSRTRISAVSPSQTSRESGSKETVTAGGGGACRPRTDPVSRSVFVQTATVRGADHNRAADTLPADQAEAQIRLLQLLGPINGDLF